MTCPAPDAVRQGLFDTEGRTAVPRQNGELLFTEPWESRAFGLVVTLHDRRAFAWEEFRERLAARISQWEDGDVPDADWNYYRCWVQALEDVVLANGVLTLDEVRDRTEQLAGRPKGHDHEHGH